MIKSLVGHPRPSRRWIFETFEDIRLAERARYLGTENNETATPPSAILQVQTAQKEKYHQGTGKHLRTLALFQKIS